MKEITFPCMNTKMVSVDMVVANDYNPNSVASKEMELLRISIEEDGVTQPVVVFYDKEQNKYIVIDGFHRYSILTKVLKCPEIPVVVLDKDIKERMASTIRHNRARGKHQVNLQAELVKSLLLKGWNDEQIAQQLGMTPEELLRLKQSVGIAEILAGKDYSREWIIK